MSDTVTVTIKQQDGTVERSYNGQVVKRDPALNKIVVETAYDGETHDLGEARLDPGDRLNIHFYEDRMYNVVQIHDHQADQLEGWYCNFMSQPEMNNGDIIATDLKLALYVRPDQRGVLVLNRDDYDELDLSHEIRQMVDDEMAGLVHAATEDIEPFGTDLPTMPPADRSMPGPDENIAKDPKRDIRLNDPRTDEKRTHREDVNT